ncbi:mannose-6-phosphate isomerase [Alkalihalobacillus alcalophilus ATCC 27647 = CGMCC 1.3604]|uniref:Mannose-6-phosphate isomerase n=1 Tax=Alkalihalobacillus alcalophilus ATCC 27647 = CGMCC 1.3604 TaxID=1218173 RepID=A0A094WLU4_ALKAL|nr:mannose-6-phosphate isomerase, class I [Alkalihalobacillus alcalophilus]KGA97801.1 mannose-6-phosphate isomerase [Alkalihalobacillus alcalophilus ATCC 27647 = CGMCC 1.3604]MED1563786.1 mannose-6-phosphate isomerase, class I [Alkalihalobacillus alcalophilus]THG89713.1 mannose-6-phosphate isomerase [Alkalihalobacillus alcalophilus ATCC 27647 = CGMCC 1.3604]
MYKEPMFLAPVFKDRIWGGTKLSDRFGYDIPTNTTGECWGISAHPNGPSRIKNGPLKGKTLMEAWDQHRELFSNEKGEQFPLLVKILDANNDLSVQVHPNDEYANSHENGELGKTECWYVIDCEPESELIIGHHGKTKEEFVSMIEKGEWDKLLKKVPIQPGDFYYVPSGTIHAIGKGALILETQQSSDTTYRVYDYDRKDVTGNTRELHLEQSITVTTIPHQDARIEQVVSIEQGLTIKKLVSEQYFTVFHGLLQGTVDQKTDGKYLLYSVLNGKGVITVNQQSYPYKTGDHFVIPSTIDTYELTGNAEFIYSFTS